MKFPFHTVCHVAPHHGDCMWPTLWISFKP